MITRIVAKFDLMSMPRRWTAHERDLLVDSSPFLIAIVYFLGAVFLVCAALSALTATGNPNTFVIGMLFFLVARGAESVRQQCLYDEAGQLELSKKPAITPRIRFVLKIIINLSFWICFVKIFYNFVAG